MVAMTSARLRYLNFRLRILPLIAGVMLVLWGVSAFAAPKADLWEHWTAHDPASKENIDHSEWTGFLTSFVSAGPDGVNRVDYARAASQGRGVLDAYLERLGNTRISQFNRNEQRAYWINLYNALTVRVILDHYPVESILKIDISPGFFSPGPWGKKLFPVEGEALSLDDIEHRILRPIWKDPRIHYAVNCASIGCPDLAARAYSGATTENMLTSAARAYVNHPRAVEFASDGLYVSSIYKWYEVDFGGGDKGVIAHLKGYAAPALAKKLEAYEEIRGHKYDWSLNDAMPSS